MASTDASTESSSGTAVGEVEDTRPAGGGSRSYFLYASCKGPDGNGWLLHEITTRLSGREWED